jgi:hypothetical protein
MAKKLSQEDRAYLNQCKAWLKGQSLAIKDCLNQIKHMNENIHLYKQRVELEKRELSEKYKMRATVLDQMAKVKKG